MIKSMGDQLHSTLPQAGMAMNALANTVGQAGENYERRRVDMIIKGTHPTLIPIKRMLLLQAKTNDALRQYLIGDLALQELLVSSPDEAPLAKQHEASANKKLFKRFVGAWFRRKYLTRGIETDVGATSMFSGVQRKDVPYGIIIKDGDIVVQFEDSAKAFKHTLTLGKHYIQHDSNKYAIHSMWMDEEFGGIFDSIGWLWLQQYLMAPVCVSHAMTLADFECIPDAEMLTLVTEIPEINTIQSWNKVTMYYPGDGAEFLPKCRVDVSYHYYSGSDKHQLTIKVVPDDNLLALGLDGSPQRREVQFTDAPTPIQKWIRMHIEAEMAAKIAEVKAENEHNK
jgi:hypothetical protein